MVKFQNSSIENNQTSLLSADPVPAALKPKPLKTIDIDIRKRILDQSLDRRDAIR